MTITVYSQHLAAELHTTLSPNACLAVSLDEKHEARLRSAVYATSGEDGPLDEGEFVRFGPLISDNSADCRNAKLQ